MEIWIAVAFITFVALLIYKKVPAFAARALDGASQFFTRAYDFGFTRSLPETERFWPPDSILKDVVRVVRRSLSATRGATGKDSVSSAASRRRPGLRRSKAISYPFRSRSIFPSCFISNPPRITP